MCTLPLLIASYLHAYCVVIAAQIAEKLNSTIIVLILLAAATTQIVYEIIDVRLLV